MTKREQAADQEMPIEALIDALGAGTDLAAQVANCNWDSIRSDIWGDDEAAIEAACGALLGAA